jgi:CheY-like chemotaxis protein
MSTPSRILVVDPSPTLQRIFQRMLTAAGYEVAGASDGVEALELLRAGGAFDLALVEIPMPRLDGAGFCAELRASGLHEAVPVVIASAKGEAERRRVADHGGAVGVVAKPFDGPALLSAVREALARSAEQRTRKPEPPPQRTSAIAGELARALAPQLGSLPREPSGAEAPLASALQQALQAALRRGLAFTSSAAPPSGAREVLQGDLTAIPLPEVLQMLHLQRQTGVLRVTDGQDAMTISLGSGLIELVQSDPLKDDHRLARFFLARGALARDVLERFVAERKPNGQLGELLLQAGLIGREELREALVRQSSELVYELVRWTGGRFSFSYEPFSPEVESASLSLGVSGLVLEGFRRLDEWAVLEESLDRSAVLAADANAVVAADGEGKLSRTDRRILDVVDGRRTMDEVVEESALGAFDALSAIQQLLKSRVLRIPRA